MSTFNHLQRPAKFITISLGILVASAAFYCISRTYVDTDLWLRLKYGMDFWQLKTIPTHDPYSFLTAKSNWINPEWLVGIIAGFIYPHMGWFGLVLFKACVYLCVLALIFRLLLTLKLNEIGIALFLLVSAILLSPAINTTRCHMFSILFFSILLMLLRQCPKSRIHLCLLPMVFLFWVNTHGGFLVGLLVLSAYTAIYTIVNLVAKTYNNTENIWLWVITVLCWSVSLINPYGLMLPLTVLQACTISYPGKSELPEWNNPEWHPIEITSVFGILWALITILAIFSLSLYKGPKNLTRILTWFPCAAAPLVSLRHLPFFVIATLYFLGEHLVFMWTSFKKSQPLQANKLRSMDIIFIIVSTGISLWLIVSACQFYTRPQLTSGFQNSFPTAAIGLLKRAGFKGNLVVPQQWGAYAVWHLYPDVKVSWDGRADYLYSQQVLLANALFLSGEGPWDYLLNNFTIDAVLVPKDLLSANLMRLKPGWEFVYNDNCGAIFLPTNSSQLPKLGQILSQIKPEDREKQLSLPLF